MQLKLTELPALPPLLQKTPTAQKELLLAREYFFNPEADQYSCAVINLSNISGSRLTYDVHLGFRRRARAGSLFECQVAR